MKYILILNDGTDEIYNLNCIEDIPDMDSFKDSFKGLFYNASLSSKSFLEVENGIDLSIIMDASNGFNQSPEQDLILSLIMDRFVTWNTLKRNWDKPNKKHVVKCRR